MLMLEFNPGIRLLFLSDFPAQPFHLLLQHYVVIVRPNPFILLHESINHLLHRCQLSQQVLLFRLLLPHLPFVPVQCILQSFIVQLHLPQLLLQVLYVLLQPLCNNFLRLHPAHGPLALAEAHLAGDVGTQASLCSFLGSEGQCIDDLCAETINEFIAGLGHQLYKICQKIIGKDNSPIPITPFPYPLLQFIVPIIINMARLAESVLVTPKIKLRKEVQVSQERAKRTIDLPRTEFSQRYQLNKQFSHEICRRQRDCLDAPFFDKNQSSRLANSRGIRQAENDLEDRYKKQLSGYLRQKFKQLVVRKQQIDTHQRLLTSALSRSSSSQSLTMRQLITLSKHSPHKERVINQAYLLNAKERIDRMVALKRKREEYYSDIRDNLKRKLMERQTQRNKTTTGEERKGGGRIKQQEWDRQWLNEYVNEKSRYRKRLINKKFNRKFQDTP